MPRSALSSGARGVVGAILAVLLLGAGVLLAQQAPPAPPPPDQALSPDQLDDLVAPIALYPDPLLSQVLVAATYPLEVVQANQWGARGVVGAILAVLLLGAGVVLAQQAPPAPPPPDQALSPDQLDDLVAPIALYPDPTDPG